MAEESKALVKGEERDDTKLVVAPAGKALPVLSFRDLLVLAQDAAESALFPGIQKKAQALVKIMAGRELGLGPITSLRLIDVVQGKVRLSAEATAGLIKRSGRYDYTVKALTEQEAVLDFTDRGKVVYTSRFSLEDARRAGLVKPDSGWIKYPRALLFARAITQGAKIVCPQVLAGAEVWEAEGYDVVNGQVTKEGEPPASAWASFWVDTKAMGYATREEVHNALQADSVKDRLELGQTLDTILAELRSLKAEKDIKELFPSTEIPESSKEAVSRPVFTTYGGVADWAYKSFGKTPIQVWKDLGALHWLSFESPSKAAELIEARYGNQGK